MRIAIITGGESGERDISIKSASNLVSHITFAVVDTFVFPEQKERFLASYKDYAIAIPMIHGKGGEDGVLQQLLASMNFPYLFSHSKTHAIGIDKRITKDLVKTLGIKVPDSINSEKLSFPLFAKPTTGGSSIASKLCRSEAELDLLLTDHPGVDFLFETPIHGREFTVGVIEYQGKTFALPVVEIIPKTDFFDFESKYDTEKLAHEVCPANITDELTTELQNCALKVHNAIGARQISRSDFIVTETSEITFLEINTIPGMTSTSLIPKMLSEKNIQLEILLQEWCNQTLKQ